MKRIAVIAVLTILIFGQANSQSKQKKEIMDTTEQNGIGGDEPGQRANENE